MARSSSATSVGMLGVCVLFGAAVASGQTAAVHVESAKATYKELAPGVSMSVVWGDIEKGPYGAFVKFVPGHSDGLHTHTSNVRLLMIKGAYVYKPEKGKEQRVGPGEFLFVPGGDRHATGSDAKEGALFYMHQEGAFDLKPVQ